MTDHEILYLLVGLVLGLILGWIAFRGRRV